MSKIMSEDRKILKELAKHVAEIAALPIQNQTKKLWIALNGLRPVRPMVLIDQIPWHEMDIDAELELKTTDTFCRSLEQKLRRTLYLWKHMRVDMVVEPFIEIPKVIQGFDFGVSIKDEILSGDDKNDVVSHRYIDQLQTWEDLEKIHAPEVFLDDKATAEAQEKAEEIFEGILDVKMQGYLPNFALWDTIAMLRGVTNILYDLVDRPDFLHAIMARFTDAYLSMLDQLEAKGLLGYGRTIIHCTGAYTDELPAPGFDPKRPRAKDLWTMGMAQLFATVSPEMHQEFELNYAVKWYSRFGLVYYGCCEPLHDKIDIVRKIPNLRKISMSPWVDVEKGAERIGRSFVFSRKPNPAFLAENEWDVSVVKKDLMDTMDKCSRYGCPLEYILKDISTVRYQPQRLWEWAEVAMKVVEQI